MRSARTVFHSWSRAEKVALRSSSNSPADQPSIQIFQLRVEPAGIYQPMTSRSRCRAEPGPAASSRACSRSLRPAWSRSEEHTSELQSRGHLVCRLLLEKKNNSKHICHYTQSY